MRAQVWLGPLCSLVRYLDVLGSSLLPASDRDLVHDSCAPLGEVSALKTRRFEELRALGSQKHCPVSLRQTLDSTCWETVAIKSQLQAVAPLKELSSFSWRLREQASYLPTKEAVEATQGEAGAQPRPHPSSLWD